MFLFVLVFFFQSGIPLHIITPLHVIDYTKKSELLRAFRLVAIHDLLEDRRINDVTANFSTSLLYKTNTDSMLLLFGKWTT